MISFLQTNVKPGELLFEDSFPTGPITDRWEVPGGEWEANNGILTGRYRGIVGSTCFLSVDGELVVTLSDPDPISAHNCNRVGLGVYCSQIQVRDFRVYRAIVENVKREYTANF